MVFSKKHERFLSLIPALLILSLVLIYGDGLYIGIWYYITVPVVTYAIGAIFKPKPLFQFGSAISIALFFLMYLYVNWERHEGLLGLGHLFSLPGGIAGLLISAIILSKKQNPSYLYAFVIGFLGISLGLFTNQIWTCNYIISCRVFPFF